MTSRVTAAVPSSPMIRSRSPIKTTTTTHIYNSPGKVERTTRDRDDRTSETSEETYNREVTERKTTILDEPGSVGDRETYKKTTITETEETIQKTEFLKFTQVAGAPLNSVEKEIDPLKLLEERRNQRRKERVAGLESIKKSDEGDRTEGAAHKQRTSVTKTVKFGDGESQKLSDFNNSGRTQTETSSRSLGSPSKFGSCRDRSSSPPKTLRIFNATTDTKSLSSPSRMVVTSSVSGSPEKNSTSPTRAWSPIKDTINYVFNTSVVEEEDETQGNKKTISGQKTPQNEQADEAEDWDLASARKRRLQSLAKKFHVYDEGMYLPG